MSAYLLCLNLLLATRLVYLRADAPLRRRANAALWLAQAGLLALCFTFNLAFWLVLMLLAAIAVFNLPGEKALRPGDWRLFTLALLLIGIDFFNAGTAGLQIRPQLAGWLQATLGSSQLLQPLGSVPGDAALAIAFGLLLLANEVNLAIRLVFHVVGIDPAHGLPKARRALAASTIDSHEFNTGRVIGVLERWLIYLVVISAGELAAIGLIIAAKGLARMKQLDDKLFAEYMLIGTFLSLLSAVLVGKWVERVMLMAP